MDLYQYLTENGKHKIKEVWVDGQYAGYQVVDKYSNVLYEKIFPKK